MGCIIYELCSGRPPFDAKTHFHLVQKIKDGRFEPLPSGYSDDLKSVVSSCLQVNPSKRPTTKDIVNLPLVRLMRGQRETLKLGRTLKERETFMNQKVKEAEALLAKSDTDRLEEAQRLKVQIRAELTTEIDDRLRREWEVKARLEIDKHSKAEQERLQGIFDTEFDKRVQAEVFKQVESIRKSLVESTASSQVPALSSVGTADTPPTDLSAHLSSMSFDSPLPPVPTITSLGGDQNSSKGKKHIRTPFARARTQIDSPMDVQMTSPSPMCASLSLSPRRAAALANARLPPPGQNLFAANAVAAAAVAAQAAGNRERWQPQLLSDLNSEAEDGGREEEEDDEDADELPALPSPTRPPRGLATAATAGVRDPFKAAPSMAPGRPAFRRQSTLPVNNSHVAAQQPALFSAINAGAAKMSSAALVGQNVNKLPSPTSPTRRPPPARAPLQKALSTAAIAGAGAGAGAGSEDLGRAVTQRNMLAGNANANAGANPNVNGSGNINVGSNPGGNGAGLGAGRTLVELAQARTGVSSNNASATVAGPPGLGSKGEEHGRHGENVRPAATAPAVWDPERDEMPSPFLVRNRRGVAAVR